MKNAIYKELALFGLFVTANDDEHPWFQEPFSQGGYVYAASRCRFIRAKKGILKRKYRKRSYPNMPDLPRTPQSNITAEAMKTALASVPQVPEITYVFDYKTCEECEGECEVDWEYTDKAGDIHHEIHDCPVCNGRGLIKNHERKETGRMIPDEDATIGIGGIAIKAENIQVLLETMNKTGVDKVEFCGCAYGCAHFILNKNISVGFGVNNKKPAAILI